MFRLARACVAVVGIASASLASTSKKGDIFVATAGGNITRYEPPAKEPEKELYLGAYELCGMAFDRDGKLYATTFNGHKVVKLDPVTGSTLQAVAMPADRYAESMMFDRQGNFYVGSACRVPYLGDPTPIFKYDEAGRLLQRWDGLKKDERAVDWIDLAPDQHTIFYTSEGRHIFRFDTRTGRQSPDFATLPGEGTAYALRLLPDGGVLVADAVDIKRLDARGEVVRKYSIPGSGPAEWFALNLDPDGKSFWSGDQNRNIV